MRRLAHSVGMIIATALVCVGLSITADAHPGHFGGWDTDWSHSGPETYSWRKLLRFALGKGELTLHYTLSAGHVLGRDQRAGMDTDSNGTLSEQEKQRWIAVMAERVAREVRLTVDGARVELTFPERQGVISGEKADAYLPVHLRLSQRLAVPVRPGATHRIELRDSLHLEGLYDAAIMVQELPGIRFGRAWRNGKEAKPGTVVRFIKPRRGKPYTYEAEYIEQGPGAATSPPERQPRTGAETSRLAEMVSAQDLSPAFIAWALLAALVLGAFHALSPGHGKTLVAAYLVGARGTVRHAVALGLIVTITHTFSVVLLGVAVLWTSQYVMPERLYPWLGLAAGALILIIGVWLFSSRLRRLGRDEQAQANEPAHSHSHTIAPDVSLVQLVVLGATGGMVPCPSALVVLLSAVALHRVAFGLTLIVAFSFGLAAVLIAIGIMVVKAGKLLTRLKRFGWISTRLPVASAIVVALLGAVIAAQALLSGGLISINV